MPAAASDEELMTHFRASAEGAAFEELVRRYTPRAYRTAFSILGRGADAEDAVQECFLRVVRRRATYRPGMPFAVWFFTVLRNLCRDEMRRTVRAADRPPPAPAREPAADAPSLAERAEEGAAALAAFERLAEREREVLALRIHDGLKFAEIAAICGISEEAAKKRAQRALDRLRRDVAAEGGEGRDSRPAAAAGKAVP
ncbi:MAG: RNA polymerase sigma factor [Planctomycetota bacterium]